MKKISITIILACISYVLYAQNEFEDFVKKVCKNTYDIYLYDETNTDSIIGKQVIPRGFLYKYENEYINHVLKDTVNNILTEKIVNKYDTTKNKDLQYLFFLYYVNNWTKKMNSGQNVTNDLNTFLTIISDTAHYYLDNILYIQETALMNINVDNYNIQQIKIITDKIQTINYNYLDTFYKQSQNDPIIADHFNKIIKYYINYCLIASRLYLTNEKETIIQISHYFNKYNNKNTYLFQLALARLNEESAIKQYLSILEENNSVFMTLSNEISFILKKEIIDYLINTLFTENYSSLNEESGEFKIYYKYEAFNILKQIIDFNFSDARFKELNQKLSFISSSNMDDELERMRLYFKTYKNYLIKKEPNVFYNVENW